VDPERLLDQSYYDALLDGVDPSRPVRFTVGGREVLGEAVSPAAFVSRVRALSDDIRRPGLMGEARDALTRGALRVGQGNAELAAQLGLSQEASGFLRANPAVSQALGLIVNPMGAAFDTQARLSEAALRRVARERGVSDGGS